MGKVLTEQKSFALELFLLGWQQNRIAAALQVSEKTISSWVKKEKWAEKRGTYKNAEAIRRAMLQKIYDAQLKELSEMADAKTPFTKGTLDSLHKLHAMLKDKAFNIHQIIELFTEFTDFTSTYDDTLGKKLKPIIDKFFIVKKNNAMAKPISGLPSKYIN